MKELFKILGLLALCMFVITSCEKDDADFCIKDINVSGTLAIGQVTITVPGEPAYTGVGALTGSFKIGKYEGQLSSVVIKQTPTEGGSALVELRHFFDDGKGNKFWTHDHATFTPVNGSQTVFNVYDEMSIWAGEGDFKHAGGMLINRAVADFGANKLNYTCTGTVCGSGN
jgi:hypothetical protein